MKMQMKIVIIMKKMNDNSLQKQGTLNVPCFLSQLCRKKLKVQAILMYTYSKINLYSLVNFIIINL